ncbi:hypothetical protein [Salirhabdus salicampi]|uniref:hypothetical protein n=1 Tax=Salirhabdus salicampi TaxID=476102 RepID=UPI0020C43545|nr:hypothetical protein [Salirhabdus salicampi]MCP8615955.1 hypothetical protein [Salirhabdus salicampi]
MKRLVLFILLMMLFILGCSDEGLKGEQPPDAYITIGGKSYETILGTYCWSYNGKGLCVDTAGPKELLAFHNEEPIKVQPEETITFTMDFEPKPTEVHATVIKGQNESKVDVANNSFTAPKEKGVYYYYYGVWWKDDKESDIYQGDAFYAFALEVRK